MMVTCAVRRPGMLFRNHGAAEADDPSLFYRPVNLQTWPVVFVALRAAQGAQ
jgi:hypothetical protein